MLMLCNKKLFPLPAGANWPHLLQAQQMYMVYFVHESVIQTGPWTVLFKFPSALSTKC